MHCIITLSDSRSACLKDGVVLLVGIPGHERCAVGNDQRRKHNLCMHSLSAASDPGLQACFQQSSCEAGHIQPYF